MRTRYHIINKDPNAPGPGFDARLWVVHYGPNEPGSRIPIDRIPVPMPIRQIFTERQFIESQGALTRKEFMFDDRSNWPTIHLAQRAQPGMYPGGAQPQPGVVRQHPQQQQFYPQQAGVGAPPAKRQRQNPSALQNAVVAGMPHDNIIEDEENAVLGDYLDHLTPAEISKIRYKQHHEWMEEIFSSVYSISQIVPEELGLGLSGELKALTDGIFNSPTPQDVLKAPAKDPQSAKVQEIPSRGYEKLSPEKQEEFEQRMAKYVEKGQAEIEAMKAEHAKMVNDFKRTRTYMSSERKLRDPGLLSRADVEDVTKEVEMALNVTISSRTDKVTIEKGGLEEEDKSRLNGNAPTNGSSGPGSNGTTGLTNFGGEGDNSAANLLDQFGSGSYANTPSERIPTPQISASASSGAPTPGATAGPNIPFEPQQDDKPSTDADQDDAGMDLIEGMDLDVDLSGLEDEVADEKTSGEDWVMVDDAAQNTTAAASATESSTVATTTNPPPAPEETKPEEPPATTSAEAPVDTPTLDSTPGAADIFAGTDFDTFDNLDTAGDALAEFTAGDEEDDLGLDLGDGAFDDAFQGTEGVESPEGGN
jgi:hypothetical protein